MRRLVNAKRFCSTRTSPFIGLVLFLICLVSAQQTSLADEWHFSDVERIVAVGDVHGAYDALVATLQNAGVIDDDLKWSGGRTHLVSTGDLLDRGAESRRVMDLMMRLEGEAAHAGGQVHQLLGNHEVMNLIGDLRYVADAEFASYLDIESPEERELQYQQFSFGKPAGGGGAAIMQEFNRLAPPGFFGHRRAFRSDGHYGKWLLQQPFMVVVNDIAFVHGGAPHFVSEYGIDGVNVALNADLVGYVDASQALVESGALSPLVGFKQVPKVLSAMLEEGQLDGEDLQSARNAIDFSRSPLHGPAGPTWYRGTSRCNRFVEGATLGAALSEIGATRVVVGHTTAKSRNVQQRMGGRVFEIDTGMLNRVYGGSGNALVIENGAVRVVNQDPSKEVVPLVQPIQVGFDDRAISEEDVARVLRTGRIDAVAAKGVGWQLLQVSSGDLSVHASFRALPGGSGFAPELAAYRLDRQLRLGMVPVTVKRNIDGQQGTLQLVPGSTLTERERVASGKGQTAACSLILQQNAMTVFDALIQNPTRSPSSMVYDPDDWKLMLVDNNSAFSDDRVNTSYLSSLGSIIGSEWQAALRELDDDVLQEQLGDALDSKRLRAVRKRRDALIR